VEKNAAGAGDKQLGSCAGGKMKYAALCVQWQEDPRGVVLRRVGIGGLSYAAAPMRVSTVATSPAPAVQSLGVTKNWGGVGGRGAAAAGDKQLGCCTAGNMTYTALCVQW
jgi:hypothetical protein